MIGHQREGKTMLRVSAFALLCLCAGSASAQQGTIAYTHAVRIDAEAQAELRAQIETRLGNRRAAGGQAPTGRAPTGAQGRAGGQGRPGLAGGPFEPATERVYELVLFFDESATLLKPVPRQAPARGGPGGDRRAAFGARLRAFAPGGQDVLNSSFAPYDEPRVVESRKLLGRDFLVADERPPLEWKLTSEQAEFLGYMVLKATAQEDSAAVEAWFTPQIPLPGGPGHYRGLPGMILVVSVDDGRIQYTATEVSMAAVADGVIVEPTEGESVTREEYDAVVIEKMEELRRTRGGGL